MGVAGIAKSHESSERQQRRVVWEINTDVVHRPVLGTMDDNRGGGQLV